MPDHQPDTACNALDATGWERRASVRREDDRTFYERCSAFAKEAIILLTFASVLAVAAGSLLAVFGFKFSGTPQAIAEVRQSQDSLARRVGRLETRADRNERSLTFITYMQCMQRTPHDPIALDRCGPIIAGMQAQASP